MAAIFIFSLRKFVENPAGITFILALPTLVAIFVNPLASFLSDRIWTKWGRRKPFVIPSMLCTVLAFALMPIMPTFWGLMVVFFFYHLTNELGVGAQESLKQEVVPPKQRTAAAAIGTWMSNLTNILFYICALGRFDDFQYFAGVPISGEESIYWGIGAGLLMLSLLLMLGVKETPQDSKLRGQKLTARNFFGSLLNRNLWPVYLLITGWAVSNAGLGALGSLLYTEQWGFSKQEMGINVAVGGVLNIFVIAILGLFAYKLPRMRTFKILLLVSIFIELAFYIYVEFILFDKTPTLPEIILFGEISTIVGTLLGLMYTPLVYDYIPRNEMGTFAAGSALVGRLVRVLTLNGVGVFVAVYTMLFMPPAGDMVRICVPDPSHETDISTILSKSFPDQKLSVEAWFATNASLDRGRAFEIRTENLEMDAVRKERDKLNGELTRVLAEKGNAEADLQRSKIEGRENPQAEEVSELLREKVRELELRIKNLDSKMDLSAADFREQVVGALQQELIHPGREIQSASIKRATLYSFRLPARPNTKREARVLNALRPAMADLIDAHTTFKDGNFYFEVAVEGDGASETQGSQIASLLNEITSQRFSGSEFPRFQKADSIEAGQVLTMDIAVAEDPVNSRLSPVTLFIYRVMEMFTDAPPLEQRMWATARALRDKGVSPHVGISNISNGEAHAIRLKSLLPSGPGPKLAKPHERLTELLAGSGPAAVSTATDLYLRLITSASQNRITVLQPVLAADFAPPKYDYMSGYLWIILMSLLGFGICLLFTRREERGLIRRRGQEESEEEARAQEASSAKALADGVEDSSMIPYVPGYVPQKIGMLLFSLSLVIAGCVFLFPNFGLLLFGQQTQAIATRVVKERPGGQSIVLNSDAEILQAKERFDRSYVFWNEFRFLLPNGEEVEFRASSGMQLRPAHSLLDADGLPTTVPVAFDPKYPKSVILPAEISTWFFPGVLISFGILGMIAASVLLYYARKKVMMPNLSMQLRK